MRGCQSRPGGRPSHYYAPEVVDSVQFTPLERVCFLFIDFVSSPALPETRTMALSVCALGLPVVMDT